MADELSPTPTPTPLESMNGADVAELVALTTTTEPAPLGPDPAPQAPPGPDLDPDPPGSMSGMVTFSPAAIREFVERGFLTVQDPSFDDVVRANFKMLTAAWRVGVRADGQASPSPANDAEEETKRRFFEKLARIQA